MAKRRANVDEYSTSGDEDSGSNDRRDTNFEVSSSCRSEHSRRHERFSSPSDNKLRRCVSRNTSKRPCLNRNALMARENRQRKKEYVEKIENKLSFFKEENKSLASMIQRQDIDLKRLRAEVSYLRNILNNSSSITSLLRSMNDNLSASQKENSVAKRINGNSVRKIISAKDNEIRSGNSINHARHDDEDENPEEWRIRSSVGDSDHTYTSSSADGSVDHCNFRSVDDSVPSSCVSKDLLPPGNEHPFGLDITSNQLHQLSFDFDLASPIDLNNEDDHFFNDFGNDRLDSSTKLFDNLDNCGICLHVNSGKVSLEFCSICHLNSVASSE